MRYINFFNNNDDNDRSRLPYLVHFQQESVKIQGVAKKKKPPYQKWFTWIIMAINDQNVNKSNVVVFTCVAVCNPKQYL